MQLRCQTCSALFDAPLSEDNVPVVTVYDLTVFQQPDRKVAVPICEGCTSGLIGDLSGG